MMFSKANATQEFLDSNQYEKNSILKYERIFGHTWVSTGGENTTKEFVKTIQPKSGDKMLDVGCGTGGSACFFARYFNVNVEGVDLSTNMLSIANERIKNEESQIKEKVKYSLADITKCDYPKESFDIIYSRDTILHIKEKENLFKKFAMWLKPGGKLFITDYCRGDKAHSEEFNNYVIERGYDLRTVKEYGEIIKASGFENVDTVDGSSMFLNVLQTEVDFFQLTKDAFIQNFSKEDYDGIYNGWSKKIIRCKNGDQSWGIFYATK